MKTLITILLTMVLVIPAIAQDKIEIKPKPHCPKTLMFDSCLTCHVMSGNKFVLKETPPDAHLDYPSGVKLIGYPENPVGFFAMGDITEDASVNLRNYFLYLRRHKVKTAIIQLHSGGGSLFDAWRMKSYINSFQEDGGIVQTELPGFAASAATIVFLCGNKGHRIANPQSEMMFHELSSYEGGLFFIKKNTPSSTEEQARIMKHLQQTINDWVPTRGKIDPKEFADKVRAKEFWITGKQAFDMGFVDRLIGEK